MKGCGVVETPRIREINAGVAMSVPGWRCVCAAEKAPGSRGPSTLLVSRVPRSEGCYGIGGTERGSVPLGRGAMTTRGSVWAFPGQVWICGPGAP
jgi:hypothetical protein